MGKRAVEVSGELWQQMCTVGWRAGDKAIVECVDGLPEGATFYGVEYRGGCEVLHFVFEHPDWPTEDRDAAALPTISVVHRSYYDGARKAAEAIAARYAAGLVTVEELAEIIRVALEDCRE